MKTARKSQLNVFFIKKSIQGAISATLMQSPSWKVANDQKAKSKDAEMKQPKD